jgi:hypothetical protein
MADNSYWLIREITDVVATATEFGYRQATGEHIPWHEQVELQRRKVAVLRTIAERSPHDHDVQDVLDVAERALLEITAPEPRPHTRHGPDLEAIP